MAMQRNTAYDKAGKKGQVWVSAVLYILITTVVLLIVVELGTPVLEELKDKTIFTRTKDNFLAIDEHIKDISEEGFGSQRVIPLEIQKGRFEVSDNSIRWEMKTNADIIEAGRSVQVGDLVLASNSDVSAKKKGDSYILENSAITVNISSYGNKTSWNNSTIDLANIINYLEFKTASSKVRNTGTFDFTVRDGGAALPAGNGYTELLDEGDFLNKARLLLHVNSTKEFDLVFTLNSRADYLQVEVVNRKES